MEQRTIKLDWNKVDSFEHMTFPTMREYVVTIRREAIPIVFVPGIMGSRLLQTSSKAAVWDPDDDKSMASNFLLRGGQHRKDLLIGDSFNEGFLSVAGGRFGTPADALGAAFAKKMSDRWNSQGWSWIRPDESVTEQADFYSMPPGPNPPSDRYAMDDHITNFTSPDKVSENYNGMPKDEASRIGNEAKIALHNGWAGVAWGFYGGIIEEIANCRWDEFGLRKYFYFPTYAFGYNWTQSNRTSGVQLQQFITQVITNENSGGKLCKQVILVTHSMGGLVARACSEIAPGQKQILGIVHGAQPAVGTPAAYHQFRAGVDFVPITLRSLFDKQNWKNKAASSIIGSSAETIDPIFGHAPGPCELLPSPAYQTNKSNRQHSASKQWLYINKAGQSRTLPGSDTPFNAIYNSNKFPGFQQDPSLVIADKGSDEKSAYHRTAGPGDVLRKTMTVASTFHTDIDGHLHPLTYYSYSYEQGSLTYDEITYDYLRQKTPDQYVPTEAGPVLVQDPQSTGQGTDLDSASSGFYSMEPKKGSGDGTVAVSSATSLGSPGSMRPAQFTDHTGPTPDLPDHVEEKVIRVRAVKGLEHSELYKNSEINAFTLKAIAEIASNYCLKTIGKAKKPMWTP